VTGISICWPRQQIDINIDLGALLRIYLATFTHFILLLLEKMKAQVGDSIVTKWRGTPTPELRMGLVSCGLAVVVWRREEF
jgi:hypothetical protein